MEKQETEKSNLMRMFLCFLVIFLFWIAPPVAQITSAGMKTIGVFIGTIMLLSFVDRVWPTLLCILLMSQTGIMNLNQVLAGSLGSWIVTFIIAGFLLTNALNEAGFTARLTAYFMSRKFASRGPWIFTFSLMTLAYFVSMFLNQVPVLAFFLGFISRILKELGYTKEDRYSHLLTMSVAIAIHIGGAATPIGHTVIVLGMGIYQNVTGNTMTMFQYMTYGIPVSIVLLLFSFIMLRLLYKCDMGKFKNFDIGKVLDKLQPMKAKEKATVFIFVSVVLMWVLPGVLGTFLPAVNPFLRFLNRFDTTFVAVAGVVALALIRIDKKPIIDIGKMWTNGFNWNIVFFIAATSFIGSAISHQDVGLNAFISERLVPFTSNMSVIAVVFVFAAIACIITNFASSVTTVTVIAGVGIAMAKNTGFINPMVLALTIPMAASLTFTLPSGFATMAMLHGDENSNGGTILRYGIIMVIACLLVMTFVGFPITGILAR